MSLKKRILLIGAGCVGLPFGKHLADAGHDVTFFVKEKYRDSLAAGVSLFSQGLVNSKGECKRLIKQSAIKIDDFAISDINYEIQPKTEATIKVGKRKFIKIV